MHFEYTPQHQELIERTRQMCAPFDLEYWRELDRTESYPHEFVQACIDAGLHGLVIPKEYGG